MGETHNINVALNITNFKKNEADLTDILCKTAS